MQDFRDYLKEQMEGVPAVSWDPQSVDLFSSNDRDNLNFIFSDITDAEIVHPEVTYEQVRGLLSALGCGIPPISVHVDTFLETDGEIIQPLNSPTGQEVVYLYFAFCQDETDLDYEVLAEIVTTEELEEILDASE